MTAWSIIRFKVLPNYKVEVGFADGTSGIADLASRRAVDSGCRASRTSV